MVADAISRNLLQILRREAPNACLMPDHIPLSLWQLLTRLDLCRLEGIAGELCQASLSNNSQKTVLAVLPEVHFVTTTSIGTNAYPVYGGFITESVLHVGKIIFISDQTWRPSKGGVATGDNTKRLEEEKA